MTVDEYLDSKLDELRAVVQGTADAPIQEENERTLGLLTQNAQGLRMAAQADTQLADLLKQPMPEALESPHSFKPCADFLHHL